MPPPPPPPPANLIAPLLNPSWLRARVFGGWVCVNSFNIYELVIIVLVYGWGKGGGGELANFVILYGDVTTRQEQVLSNNNLELIW